MTATAPDPRPGQPAPGLKSAGRGVNSARQAPGRLNGRLAGVWNVLTQPPGAGRQSRLLSNLILALIALAASSIVLGVVILPLNEVLTPTAEGVLFIVVALLAGAYALNWHGHFLPAAALTIAIAGAASWLLAWTSRAVLARHTEIIFYPAISILLAGLIVPGRVTLLVGAFNMAVMTSLWSWLGGGLNWLSVFIWYLLLTVVSALVAGLRRRDLAQLERQADALADDIAARRRAEAALRESEQRYQRAFHDAAIGMAEVDLGGRWLKVNRAVCEITGYTEAELQAINFQAISHPDDLPADLVQVEQLLAGEIQAYHMEKRYFHKQGHVVWIMLSVSLMRDGAGRPSYFISQIQDISQRKAAEAALQEANSRLTEWLADAERRSREAALLNELGDLLQACRTVSEAHAIIAQLLGPLFPGDSGCLYAVPEEGTDLALAAAWGAPIASPPIVAADACWALRRGRIHTAELSAVPQPEALPPGAAPAALLACPHVPDPLPTAYMCVPLAAQGETLGLLHLRQAPDSYPLEKLGGRRWIETREPLAASVANSLALALANLRLRESLRQQSLRDPLTGLFNRRYLEETFEREIHRGRREDRPVGVIMLDLDHFKEWNDARGHEAGDQLLRELGRLLRAHTRGEDIACRYGGEEFILILPGASLAVAGERAERLCQEVLDLGLSFDDQRAAVTVSAGVAAFPDHGDSGRAVLRAADAALYRAKGAGRGRVVAAE